MVLDYDDYYDDYDDDRDAVIRCHSIESFLKLLATISTRRKTTQTLLPTRKASWLYASKPIIRDIEVRYLRPPQRMHTGTTN